MHQCVPHHATVELAGVVLKLRDGLTFSLRTHGGQHVYIVEDEINSKYYRIGIPEYTFLSLLDGHATVGEAMGRSAAVLGDQALSEREVGAICKWLVDCQLAESEESRGTHRLMEANQKNAIRRAMARFHPVTPKFPLFNPDDLLSRIDRVFGWLFSFPVFLLWLIVVIIGGYCVTSSWRELTHAAPRIVSPHNLGWILLTWLILKCVHETAHGLACKRFGGTVREMGVLFILLVPLPYVDVTSTWRFASRLHRIVTSAAGMYADLCIAAIAAVVWHQADSLIVQQHALNVMASASLVTILFNANPLMRFDGYFILTDVLDVPNLATHANQLILQIGRRYLLGLPTRFTRWPEGKRMLIALYGPLAMLWRVVVCAGIFLSAEHLFHGAGLALGLFAVCTWVVVPLVRLMRFVIWGSDTERPDRGRFFATATALVGVGAVVFAFFPWYGRVSAPAIVDYHPLVHLRTSVAGFVKEVKVAEGDVVSEGDEVVVLENQELLMELRILAARIREAEIRARGFRTAKEIPAYQVEVQNLAALESRLAEKRQQAAALTLRAPQSGLLIAKDLDSLVGSHLEIGRHVASIGVADSKQIHALVRQRDFEYFVERIGGAVDVWVWGSGKIRGRLDRVNPRAETNLIHPAFAATAGGPISVLAGGRQPDEDGNDSSTRDDAKIAESTTPLFVATIGIAGGKTDQLSAGQLGATSFRSRQGTIGTVLLQAIADWINYARMRR